MSEALTEDQLQELSRQLSCPSGEMGREVARMMNTSNLGMTEASIEALAPGENQQVLELGPGNAAHLPQILARARGLHYCGLEISETMYAEAQELNAAQLRAGTAAFHLYDGLKLPYPDEHFHRLISVNTIYFWQDPAGLMGELARCLVPGGRGVLAFAQKRFMESLPFVGPEFRLYDTAAVRTLVEVAGLQWQHTTDHTDQALSKGGELVERHFSLAVFEK